MEPITYNYCSSKQQKSQGTFKGTYKVIPSELHTHFAKKSDANSKEINTLTAKETGAYYTGKAITVADFKTKVVVYDTDDKKVLTEGKDYRLEYSDNIDAGLATVKLMVSETMHIKMKMVKKLLLQPLLSILKEKELSQNHG